MAKLGVHFIKIIAIHKLILHNMSNKDCKYQYTFQYTFKNCTAETCMTDTSLCKDNKIERICKNQQIKLKL